MARSKLSSGAHTPLITPLTGSGEVDVTSPESLAHELLADGAAGLVAHGTTAEVATPTAHGEARIVDVTARVRREHGAPLMLGAGGNRTAAAVEALVALDALPEAVAAPTLVPCFTRPSEAGAIAYFTERAAASPSRS